MVKSNELIRGVHLVGSVPLQNSSAVFELCCSTMGDYLKRVPDGETGERSNWIGWQFPILAKSPQLETVRLPADSSGNARTRIKLRDGVAVTEVEFGELGYCKAALESYAEFSHQKERGVIPSECRFQVALPTPLAPMQLYVVPEDRRSIEPVYEARLLEELSEIVANIPKSELAIQWDTAVEFGVLEGVFPTYLLNKEIDIAERLLRLGEAVPVSVGLGYHLCYGDSGHQHFVEPGDSGHQHFVEPKDTSLMVAVANSIARKLSRPLNWIHLPVPRDRFDREYYAPLGSLDLQKDTELYLGLVHDTDGIEGTRKRIEAASEVIDKFGVATECGFGRRLPGRIKELLQTHTQVASAIR